MFVYFLSDPAECATNFFAISPLAIQNFVIDGEERYYSGSARLKAKVGDISRE